MIRIQYIFTGKVAAGSRLLESEEKRLEWVDYGGLDQHSVTASTREVVAHYQETGIHNKLVYTGTMNSILGEPRVQ